MSVPTVNLTIEKGTDFEAVFNVTNSDSSIFSLTNYAAAAKIRKHSTSTSPRSFSTSITIATGEIKISMDAATTSLLSAGRNYYDVIITHNISGKIIKVFEGSIIVSETISI